MVYFILAQICLTVGTPNWVVTVCYIAFGWSMAHAVMEGIKKGLENF